MARKKISRRKTKAKARPSILPEWMKAFCAKRIVDGIAASLIALGIFLLIALISYSASDPSWNTASNINAGTANLAGKTGAFISDVIIQTIGLGGYAIALILAAWGARTLKRQPLSPLALRIIAAIFCIALTCLASAQLPVTNWEAHPYGGGIIGTIMLRSILDLIPQTISNSAFIPTLIAALSGILSAALCAYACALSRHEISIVIGFIKDIILTIWHGIAALIAWVRHNDYQRPQAVKRDPAPKKPKATKRKTQITEPAKTAKTQAPINANPINMDTQWLIPDIDLLSPVPDGTLEGASSQLELRESAQALKNVLADFNVEGDIIGVHPGPVVTLYELEPAPGTKTARVISLADDIARSMAVVSVRCAVIPGKNVIGIELPNEVRQTVYMHEMLASRIYERTSAHLPLILGKDISGQAILADLAKMPHLLVAGTTGSGKSVAVNTMILSLLFCLPPEKCRFIMIDPKMLELSVYDDIPHLLTPVVTDPAKAVTALKWAVAEMEQRYRLMSRVGVRNIDGYNARLKKAREGGEVLMHKVQTGFDAETGVPTYEEVVIDLTEVPYIVVIVDEFADLMLVAGKDVENAIQRLAQMARAAGIHIIMATQRPSVDVITGVIKANFPTRISFAVTSKIDSRTILGEGGAEQLLGLGDMLYMAPGGRITRVHGPFVSDGDVEAVTQFLRSQGPPSYETSVTDEGGDFGDSDVMSALFGGDGNAEASNKVDELYDKAVAVVAREGKASTSFIQRHLQIGYNRAARIIEEMERQGVVSKASATGKREILVRDFSDV